MSDQSIVEVWQCDRDAVADYYVLRGYTFLNDAIRVGAIDDDDMIQFVARHRIAEREACAKVAEDRCAYVIAAAIRARSDLVVS